MAKMIPTHSSKEEFNGSAGERRLYEQLQKLSDNYTIFHSVKWCNDSGQEGEADFVIIDCLRGILVVEVKSGDIVCEDGQFYQVNRRNKTRKKIKPMDQATKSVHFLVDQFEEEAHRLDIINPFNQAIMPVVWFTDVSRESIKKIPRLPMNYSKETLLVNDDVRAVEKSLNKVFDAFGLDEYEYDDDDLQFALDVMAPSFNLASCLKSAYEAEESVIVQLTDEQIEKLDDLEDNQVAAIKGGAGTGKTILAIEKAKRLSRDGSVLFLAFNRFLIDDIKNTLSNYDNISVFNLKSLANSWGSRIKTNNEHTEEAIILDRLKKKKDSFPYKHIVIDEGQDFASEHILELIEIAKKQGGNCYIFYDVNQDIQKHGTLEWLNDSGIPKASLRKNCRSTRDIADTAHSAIGIDRPNDSSELQGEKPIFYICKSDSEKRNIINESVTQFHRMGISNDRIVILSSRGTEKASKLSFDYVSSEREPGKILYTTVRKFKGLEADAVIFIDVDAKLFSDEIERELFYVGASRAKHQLTIVTSRLTDKSLNEMATYLGVKGRYIESSIEKGLKVSVEYVSSIDNATWSDSDDIVF